MKAYATNIVWDYNELSITDEQIDSLPTRVEIDIDIEICENKEDIISFHTEDVDKLCDYASCQEFDISFLGFDIDVREKITTETHHQSVRDSMSEYEGYNEMSHWDMSRHPNE